eukprot:COSAG05_NODE_8235_length_723_cov_1.625000_1_plen_127_part_01
MPRRRQLCIAQRTMIPVSQLAGWRRAANKSSSSQLLLLLWPYVLLRIRLRRGKKGKGEAAEWGGRSYVSGSSKPRGRQRADMSTTAASAGTLVEVISARRGDEAGVLRCLAEGVEPAQIRQAFGDAC